MNSLKPPLSAKGMKLSDTWAPALLVIVGLVLLIGYALAKSAPQPPPPKQSPIELVK